MRTLITSLTMILALSLASVSHSYAADGGKKNKTSPQLYEQEGDGSVSGKVKLVREVQEETEVFLEGGKGGPFVLPVNFPNRAGALKILAKSQKPGGPSVTISIDEQQRIKSIEESGDSSKKP